MKSPYATLQNFFRSPTHAVLHTVKLNTQAVNYTVLSCSLLKALVSRTKLIWAGRQTNQELPQMEWHGTFFIFKMMRDGLFDSCPQIFLWLTISAKFMQLQIKQHIKQLIHLSNNTLILLQIQMDYVTIGSNDYSLLTPTVVSGL